MYLDRCDIAWGRTTSTVVGPCCVTGKPYTLEVPTEGLLRYVQGARAQEAFPQLPNDQQEFLTSGTTPEGWTQLFGTPEEYDPLEACADCERSYGPGRCPGYCKCECHS